MATNLPSLRLRRGGDGPTNTREDTQLEPHQLRPWNQNCPCRRVDLDEYESVTIWCWRFTVSFGAAELTTP